MRCRKRWMVALALALTAVVGAGTSHEAFAQGIYTCVDGKGRKITADRPIVECMDRTQKELNRSGTIKRELPPVLTAEERAAQEAKEKQAAEARAREVEEKRRERALLQRYPDRAAHDRERAATLAHIDEVIKTASSRTPQLDSQRKALDSELEFYARDPSKVPASLKRRIEEYESGVTAQKKFIQDQEQEKKRVNTRFDEELVKLRQLWAMTGKS